MTPDEIQEYNQAYIDTYMSYYGGDGMTCGNDDDDYDDTTLITNDYTDIPTDDHTKKSSIRYRPVYERYIGSLYTCRNCPRRDGSGICPLTYTQLTSCTENVYHRHPMNNEIQIKETMP